MFLCNLIGSCQTAWNSSEFEADQSMSFHPSVMYPASDLVSLYVMLVQR